MPIFICEKCGVLENTACCSYWTLAMERHSKDRRLIWSEELKSYEGRKCLCSECADIRFTQEGKSLVVPGKWHGKFGKEYPSEDEIRRKRNKGQIIN